MKTNRVRAHGRRAAQSKQARKTTGQTLPPFTGTLPTRRFMDITRYVNSAKYAAKRKAREARPEAEQREDMESYRRRCRMTVLTSRVPGVADHRGLDQGQLLSFLARVAFTHREAIMTAVRPWVSARRWVNVREEMEIACFIARIDQAGLALPVTFQFGFLDGIGGNSNCADMKETLCFVHSIFHAHAEAILDGVWRPLVKVAPRAALELAQAIALAELVADVWGGTFTEIEAVGEGKETTAQFYARWNAELLAKGGGL